MTRGHFVGQGDIFVGQGDICRKRGHLSDKGTFLSDKGTFFVGQEDIFCRTRGHLVKISLGPQQARGARYQFGNTSKT